MRTLVRRLLGIAPVLAVAFVLSDAAPAVAETHCFSDLYACYGRAAARDDFWARWAAGLDCEVDLIQCLGAALAR